MFVTYRRGKLPGRWVQHDETGGDAHSGGGSVSVPSPWVAILLALAVFRIYRLIAEDTILDGPRRKILRLGNEWMKEGDKVPETFRAHWSAFITCPWCLGFWLSLLAWVAWLIFPTETVFLAVPWALSAAVALVAKNLDADED